MKQPATVNGLREVCQPDDHAPPEQLGMARCRDGGGGGGACGRLRVRCWPPVLCVFTLLPAELVLLSCGQRHILHLLGLSTRFVFLGGAVNYMWCWVWWKQLTRFSTIWFNELII